MRVLLFQVTVPEMVLTAKEKMPRYRARLKEDLGQYEQQKEHERERSHERCRREKLKTTPDQVPIDGRVSENKKRGRQQKKKEKRLANKELDLRNRWHGWRNIRRDCSGWKKFQTRVIRLRIRLEPKPEKQVRDSWKGFERHCSTITLLCTRSRAV